MARVIKNGKHQEDCIGEKCGIGMIKTYEGEEGRIREVKTEHELRKNKPVNNKVKMKKH